LEAATKYGSRAEGNGTKPVALSSPLNSSCHPMVSEASNSLTPPGASGANETSIRFKLAQGCGHIGESGRQNKVEEPEYAGPTTSPSSFGALDRLWRALLSSSESSADSDIEGIVEMYS